MSTLKSGIQRKLKGEFVVNEEALRRVVGVYQSKITELSFPASIVFHVKREDDRFYETELIEDVLADPNVGERKISLLNIEIRNDDPSKKPEPWERDWISAVQFDLNNHNVMVVVSSDNKNWALLLADELEPQVIRTQNVKKIPTWLLFLFYISIAFFLIATIRKYSNLVTDSFATTLKSAVYFILIFSFFMTWGSRPSYLSKWVGPVSFFDWGNQSDTYSEHEKLRQNIQWVVIAGFILSIFAFLYTSNVF